MVRPLQLAASSALLGLLLMIPTSAPGDPPADPSLACINANRDWKKNGAAMSLDDARSFLRIRVKPVCPRLANQVKERIAQLATQRRIASARVAPRLHRPPTVRPDARRPAERLAARPPAPRPIGPVPHATPIPIPIQRRAHTFRTSGLKASDFLFEYPTWEEVTARYPQLSSLYKTGTADLCAACLVGADGYLEQCEVAGESASNPAIRQGAKLMMSLIRISRRNGSSARGTEVAVPVAFGEILPPPRAGYCSSPEADFRP